MYSFAELVPRDSLIVSCQAAAGHPLRSSAVLALMARAGELGGAAAVRANGAEDVRAIRAAVSLLIIGINKLGPVDGVFITPTVEAAVEVIEAGAAIVAIDGTTRARPDGSSPAAQIDGIKRRTGAVVMADVDTVDAGLAARRAGADAVATTLSGYTPASRGAVLDGPDVELVRRLAAQLDCPVVAEGRVRDESDVAAVQAAGAHAVVVGAAITDPQAIAARFVRRLRLVRDA
ncbi:N-acetylmannosamine-6-phosphate 2-epimerase [Flindersiella endophytica]